MTVNGRIRPATLADLDAVTALEARVFASDQLSRRSLRYYITTPTADFPVLESGGRIVGDAIVAFRRGATVARLYSLAIEPDAGGRGFGRQLLAACEDMARERGCAVLRFEVRADNAPALRLYDGAGYTRFGTCDDYYEDGATALRYQRPLSLPDQAGSGAKRLDGAG